MENTYSLNKNKNKCVMNISDNDDFEKKIKRQIYYYQLN